MFYSEAYVFSSYIYAVEDDLLDCQCKSWVNLYNSMLDIQYNAIKSMSSMDIWAATAEVLRKGHCLLR